MTHPKDTELHPQNQPYTGLSREIQDELRGAHRLALYRVLDKLEAEIERLYPGDYAHLLDPRHDWDAP